MSNDVLPPVSCMCLTYGRPHLLEEAVASFLKQDYSGRKELIIINDFSHQKLVFDHPEVFIINLDRKFKTVGEKRNACAALASHDYLFVWDDDDIFLPHRLTFSIKHFDYRKGFFKTPEAFVLNNGLLSGPQHNIFHSASCFSRELFNKAHGYRHMNSGQDLDIELAFENIIGQEKNYRNIQKSDIYYIYRWSGTGSYHLSGFGKDKEGDTSSGREKVDAFITSEVKKGSIQTGTIQIHPEWKCNYNRLVQRYLGSDQARVPHTKQQPK